MKQTERQQLSEIIDQLRVAQQRASVAMTYKNGRTTGSAQYIIGDAIGKLEELLGDEQPEPDTQRK